MGNKASLSRVESDPAQAGKQNAINDTVLDSMFFHSEAVIMSRRPTRLSMELLNRAKERELLPAGCSARESAEFRHEEETAE